MHRLLSILLIAIWPLASCNDTTVLRAKSAYEFSQGMVHERLGFLPTLEVEEFGEGRLILSFSPSPGEKPFDVILGGVVLVGLQGHSARVKGYYSFRNALGAVVYAEYKAKLTDSAGSWRGATGTELDLVFTE